MKVNQAERLERYRHDELDVARQDLVRQRSAHSSLLDALEKARRELALPPQALSGRVRSDDCMIEELAQWRRRAESDRLRRRAESQQRAVDEACALYQRARSEHAISDRLLGQALEAQRGRQRRREQRQIDEISTRTWLLRAGQE